MSDHPMHHEEDTKVSAFFLPCDCKPGTTTFAVIDPFAYDIMPAHINGTLGVIHYDPPTYSVIDLYPEADPLLGYICTITHPDTIALLDKLKGFHGPDGFNFHNRIITTATVGGGKSVEAWVYVLSDKVLDCYETLEQVEFGIWDGDEQLEKLLDEIDPPDDEEDDKTEETGLN